MNARYRQIALTVFVLAAAALPFLLTPWKAQALGPDGRGQVAYFQSALTLVFGVAAMGTRLAYYEACSSGSRTARVAWRGLLLMATLTAWLTAAVFVFLGSGTMPWFVLVGIGLAAVLAPLQVVVQVRTAQAQAESRRGAVAAVTSTSALVESAGTLLLLLWRHMTVVASMGLTLLSEFIRALVALFSRRGALTDDHSVASENIVRRAVILAPAVLLPIVIANIDTLVMGALVPTALLGQFVVAKLAINVMLLVAVTLENVAIRAGRRESIRIDLCLVSLAVAGAVAGYFATPILFGDAFAPAQPAFLVTSAAGLLGTMFTLRAARLSWRGRGRAVAVASVLAVATAVVLSVLIGVAVPLLSAWMLGIPGLASYAIALVLISVRNRGTDEVA